MRYSIFIFVLIMVSCGGEEHEPVSVKAVNRTMELKTTTSMDSLIKAVERYSYDHDRRPEVSSIDDLCNALKPGYLRRCDKSDGWGNTYRCEIGDGEDFILSAGRDGEFDTPDDIKKVF